MSCLIIALLHSLPATATETAIFTYSASYGSFSVWVNYGTEETENVLWERVRSSLPLFLGLETGRKSDDKRYDVEVACHHLGKAALAVDGHDVAEVACNAADTAAVMTDFARRLGKAAVPVDEFDGFVIEIDRVAQSKVALTRARRWLSKLENVDSATLSSMYWESPGYSAGCPLWVHRHQDSAFGIWFGIYRTEGEAKNAASQLDLGSSKREILKTRFAVRRFPVYFPATEVAIDSSGL